MDLFKTLVWDNLIKAALGQLYAAFPILNLPVIGWFVQFVILKYTDLLYAGMKEWVQFKEIMIKNLNLEHEYDRADVKLRLVHDEHGPESAEYKAAAKEEADAFSNFIKFAPARS